MTTDAKRPLPILPLLGLVAALVAMFFVFPQMISNVQSESGVCGKEIHGAVTYISSLKTDKNVEGSFFLGIGSIHTERVYVAYVGNNVDGYTLIERPVSESLLFEDTNDNPYVEEVSVWVCTSIGYGVVKKYKFHVPEGTIKMEYVI